MEYLLYSLTAGLPTAFAIIIGMSCSPFIALTILAGVGSLLNMGVIEPGVIPFSETLMHLPIAQMNVFIILLIITTLKGILGLTSASKIICDVFLDKVENIIGAICAIVGVYVITSVTVVYAYPITDAAVNGNGIWTSLVMTILSLAMALVAYAIYFVMKTLIFAIDILALLASPIPGVTALATISKYVIVGIYVWHALASPRVSSIIGLVCLTAAFFLFRWSRRIILYYRKIYLRPLLTMIFRNGRTVPLVPKKMPKSVFREFGTVDVCLEVFFMNNTTAFHKRELCYFIKADDKHYLFKKRLLGKAITIKLTDDTYLEKCYRFIRIFTDEGANYRKIHAVLSREHNTNINTIISEFNLINYNLILEERRRVMVEETSQKIQTFKNKLRSKITHIIAPNK